MNWPDFDTETWEKTWKNHFLSTFSDLEWSGTVETWTQYSHKNLDL